MTADLHHSERPGATRIDELPDENPAHKQARILQGAAAVFAQDGYEGASMSRIAAEARVSKGTLYNYFSGKAELFTSHVRGICDRTLSLAFDDLNAAAPPASALSAIGMRILTKLLAEPSLTMYRMVIAEAEKFPELAEAFYAAGPARALAHASAYLRAATMRGELTIEDFDLAAAQFFALLQTHLLIKRRLRLIGMPDEADIAHVVDGAVSMFLAYYGK